MKKIEFTKMSASGNDFAAIDKNLVPAGKSYNALARKICDRKLGVGADGLLLLEKVGRRSVSMRIFNADGTEAEMCGNGARCAALWFKEKCSTDNVQLNVRAKAGLIASWVRGRFVNIKLTPPKDIELDIPLKIGSRTIKVNYINTGVPHTVIFTHGLDDIDVFTLGRFIRYHKRFSPRGTNVNFVEVLSKDTIKVRTYERGVEDETLACGTGSVASAIITGCKFDDMQGKLNIGVITRGKEKLKVSFLKAGLKIIDPWLGGKAEVVYTGKITV